ncbi:MAG: metabolite traffic protein EboE [Lentisphaerae bacterium]|nr:metabolite traffic protein EboE [Lentisphaerota bacterium]MBT4822918.1 metabolite traffic protein EboE [Lentisphaerota bacterium]MBT5609767.1 metabolite traffic protein EboE [Lentisphaerota bacterium]MBT7061409.1 metabolite traffic protein EboE [Lentisphaerota bacterium]MBT7845099.1 metabolite traffic protein EboE [Lentisphaerota bacterium]
MIAQTPPPIHLTYCLNVHPGETWEENFEAIRTKAVTVRNKVNAPGRFGLGLRLSCQAADQLVDPGQLRCFRDFLAANELYAFTVNGFPYGQFHQTSVKDRVYAPDWRSDERVTYSKTLGDVMAGILPEGVSGSISTVPGSYGPWITCDRDVIKMAENLAETAVHFHGIRNRTGQDVVLALEPEPDCFLGTMADVEAFFSGALLAHGSAWVRKRLGVSLETAEQIVRDHVGLCLDTAHMAVEFEDLGGVFGRARALGMRLAKVHLSAALSVLPQRDAASALTPFVEEVYLHQVRMRGADGSTETFADLDAAITHAEQGAGREWRVHFHVPLFFEEAGALRSTTYLFTPEVVAELRSGICPHLEIETYTFGVLPPALQVTDVTDGIAREYKWVLNHLFG